MEAMIETGDWQQIRELSRLYKDLFETKEIYIEQAIRLNLTPGQRAEAEIGLAVITGSLKEVDAKIHYLMFGGEIGSSEPGMSLVWQANKIVKKDIEWEQPIKQFVFTSKSERRLKYLENRFKDFNRRMASMNAQLWRAKHSLKLMAQLEVNDFLNQKQ